MNNLVFFGGNEIRLLLGNSPPLEEWGELTPPPSHLLPEVLDELHEVLHGLNDLRDCEIVQNLFTVTTQLSEKWRVSINIKKLVAHIYICDL